MLTAILQAYFYKKIERFVSKPFTGRLQSILTGTLVCCKGHVITSPSRAHSSCSPTLVLLQCLLLVLHLILLPLFTLSYCSWDVLVSVFLCGNILCFVPCRTTWSRHSGALSFKKTVVHRWWQQATALCLSTHYPYTDLMIIFNFSHSQ